MQSIARAMKRGGGVEARGAVVDQREAAVERLERAVREAVLDRGEDRVALLTQRAAERLERSQATAGRVADRAVEPGPGLVRSPVHRSDHLLELIAAPQARVVPPGERERRALIGVETILLPSAMIAAKRRGFRQCISVDMHKVPYPSESFDTIVSIHSVDTRRARELPIAEAFRVLPRQQL